MGWLSGVIFLVPLNLDYIAGDRKSKNLEYALPWENVLQHTGGDGQAAVAQVHTPEPYTVWYQNRTQFGAREEGS